MPKSKKQQELEQQVGELTQDVQRVRADFENYRKRAELERSAAIESGRSSAIMKLLPVIDNIERAIKHVPDDLVDNQWAQGVTKLVKNLEKSLTDMGVTRIDATEGTNFDPDVHEAVQFDEDADGEHVVIAEELQAGYKRGNTIMRPAIVRVTQR